MTLKEKIKEYVDDHYKYYAFYPYDVEVDGKLYSYEEYMAICLLYTSPSPRDKRQSRMPSSA